MSCCGILCNCNDIVLCNDCEFYKFALEYFMIDFYESIENDHKLALEYFMIDSKE